MVDARAAGADGEGVAVGAAGGFDVAGARGGVAVGDAVGVTTIGVGVALGEKEDRACGAAEFPHAARISTSAKTAPLM